MLNPYIFCINNPINFIDLSGGCAKPPKCTKEQILAGIEAAGCGALPSGASEMLQCAMHLDQFACTGIIAAATKKRTELSQKQADCGDPKKCQGTINWLNSIINYCGKLAE